MGLPRALALNFSPQYTSLLYYETQLTPVSTLVNCNKVLIDKLRSCKCGRVPLCKWYNLLLAAEKRITTSLRLHATSSGHFLSLLDLFFFSLTFFWFLLVLWSQVFLCLYTATQYVQREWFLLFPRFWPVLALACLPLHITILRLRWSPRCLFSFSFCSKSASQKTPFNCVPLL